MSRLIGGNQLIFNCLVYYNGMAVTLTAMIDTGANGYAFIDRQKARELRKSIQCTRTQLVTSISTTGFDGQQRHYITHATNTHIYIDSRVEQNVPFLELELGSHDIILRRKWLV